MGNTGGRDKDSKEGKSNKDPKERRDSRDSASRTSAVPAACSTRSGSGHASASSEPSPPLAIPISTPRRPPPRAVVGSPDFTSASMGAGTPIPDSPTGKADGMVSETFTWRGKAHNVAITGTFNNWGAPVHMHRVPDETDVFQVAVPLPPGDHQYKFIVDSSWTHDSDKPTVANNWGSLNNLVQVASEMGPLTNEPTAGGIGAGVNIRSLASTSSFGVSDDFDFEDFVGGQDTPPGSYKQDIPEMLAGRPPPVLPPHLLQVTLNSNPIGNDPTQLPEPNHVLLNHLYALSVKDHVMVLGATHRFKHKYVTTVLYKPVDI